MRKSTLKIALIIIFSYFVFWWLAPMVLAVSGPTPLSDSLNTTATQSGLVPEDIAEVQQTPDLEEVIGKYIKIGLGFLGIIFLIMVLYAGMMWMTATGDTELVQKAKRVLVQAAIGLAVTLIAYQATHFIISQISETAK